MRGRPRSRRNRSERASPRLQEPWQLVVGAILPLIGVDPLKLTEISMALTAASLPIGVLPFLILMNDKAYLGEHTNRHIGNAVVMIISVMALVLAVVSIPLEIVGS